MRLTIPRPDDMHLHLRDGAMLQAVVPYTARQFARAIIMPNLVPPVTTVAMAEDYRSRIMAALPEDSRFEPLMTLYLTDATTVAEIEKAAAHSYIHAVKLYPAGATTNSASGVTDLSHVMPVLEKMAALDLPLLVHGEVTDAEIDIFDREKVFIERKLAPLVEKLPELKVVFEHITTAQGAQFVADSSANVAATITPHHLLMNRNDLLVGGVRPHHYCLPVLKRERHREKLVERALSGSAKFFAGTDSAPHLKNAKEADCGCAGAFVAHAAVELYAEAFDRGGDMSQESTQKAFTAFMSYNGASFYGLPLNKGNITLTKRTQTLEEEITVEPDGTLVPLWAGQGINWLLA